MRTLHPGPDLRRLKEPRLGALFDFWRKGRRVRGVRLKMSYRCLQPGCVGARLRDLSFQFLHPFPQRCVVLLSTMRLAPIAVSDVSGPLCNPLPYICTDGSKCNRYLDFKACRIGFASIQGVDADRLVLLAVCSDNILR
jgi:hypothetical protein